MFALVSLLDCILADLYLFVSFLHDCDYQCGALVFSFWFSPVPLVFNLLVRSPWAWYASRLGCYAFSLKGGKKTSWHCIKCILLALKEKIVSKN